MAKTVSSTRRRVKQPETTPKSNKKIRSEEYLKYQRYIKSKDFKAVREVILERDNHTCKACGWNYDEPLTEKNKRSLQCHHSTYKNLYNELKNLDDLITLCNVCHRGIHRSPLNMKRFALK